MRRDEGVQDDDNEKKAFQTDIDGNMERHSLIYVSKKTKRYMFEASHSNHSHTKHFH